MPKDSSISDEVSGRLLTLRGERVLLSSDLARLYQVEVMRLIEAVSRNRKRFPPDFMFQLDRMEWDNLKSQFAISSWGGARKPPYAFTEQGVAMLSSVLRSPRAIAVNIEIMRAFVRMRRMVGEHAELAARLDRLEKDYDVKRITFPRWLLGKGRTPRRSTGADRS